MGRYSESENETHGYRNLNYEIETHISRRNIFHLSRNKTGSKPVSGLRQYGIE